MIKKLIIIGVFFLTFGIARASFFINPFIVSPGNVVISQVYGGGGGLGATYNKDFIELHNNTEQTIDLSTWSVQYASAAGTAWQRTDLSGTIAPGGYFLISQAGGAVGLDLPTIDVVGSIGMNANNGKVLLSKNQTTITTGVGCPIPDDTIADFVGYGTADCYEGAGATGGLSASTAAIRNSSGCTDVNNNSADFTVTTPNPMNTASTPVVCPA